MIDARYHLIFFSFLQTFAVVSPPKLGRHLRKTTRPIVGAGALTSWCRNRKKKKKKKHYIATQTKQANLLWDLCSCLGVSRFAQQLRTLRSCPTDYPVVVGERFHNLFWFWSSRRVGVLPT